MVFYFKTNRIKDNKNICRHKAAAATGALLAATPLLPHAGLPVKGLIRQVFIFKGYICCMMKKMIKPPALQEGDTVAVIAPSGLVDRELTEVAIEQIGSWGYNVRRAASLYEKHGIFAGTDGQRLAGLQSALDDEQVKAVICARGGYGLSRIIDRLDFSAFSKRPKWIVGYSDISVLHLFVNCRLGISTIHGEMPLNYHKNEPGSAAMLTLRQALAGRPPAYEWHASHGRDGQAEAVLTGGNLSLIASLMGTDIRACLKDKILFIEERGEYMYSLDRMITGLRLSGVLAGLKGLVVGGLTGIKESPVKYAVTAEEIITGSLEEYDFPVAFGFPAGHIPDNRALYMGAHARLKVKGMAAGLDFL